MRWRVVLFAVCLAELPAAAEAQATAERLYTPACEGGDVLACNLFGLMLETGRGVTRDLARAATLYRTACEAGAAVGCTNLGRLYHAGAGVEADSATAAGLYRVACEGGDLLGCELWGVLSGSPASSAERYFKPGRVWDAETGAPLADAIVDVPAVGARSISDASGRVALGGLPPGRHRLVAERSGYDVLESEIEVPGLPQFAVLLTPTAGIDPRAAGHLVGQVSEDIGPALATVDVSIVGQEDKRTLTNGQGNFTLRDVAPGVVALRFSRLGYIPRTATVVVQPEATLEVNVTLSVEPIQLEAVEVSVRSRSLEQNGFYDRAEAGWGTHFRPSDLAELQPVVISDALRSRIPGVRVEQDIIGGRSRLISRRSFSVSGGECPLQVFIDGLGVDVWDIDLFPAEMIEAIEVYQGVETPVQYGGGVGDAACGAVLLWTRRAN